MVICGFVLKERDDRGTIPVNMAASFKHRVFNCVIDLITLTLSALILQLPRFVHSRNSLRLFLFRSTKDRRDHCWQ